jgi:hypothetical protein
MKKIMTDGSQRAGAVAFGRAGERDRDVLLANKGTKDALCGRGVCRQGVRCSSASLPGRRLTSRPLIIDRLDLRGQIGGRRLRIILKYIYYRLDTERGLEFR